MHTLNNTNSTLRFMRHLALVLVDIWYSISETKQTMDSDHKYISLYLYVLLYLTDGDGKRESNPTFHRASTVELIEPCDIKGPISHLCCRKTNAIWVSNDRGQLGLINHSGKNMWSNHTCTAYSGHFTIATDNESKFERIYWVHKEEKRVYRFEYQDSSLSDTTSPDQLGEVVEEMPWEPISILFSDKTWTESDKGKKYIFVGKVAHNDAKITRYMDGEKLVKVNDIHTCRTCESTRERIYHYPAYLAENTNGDICASDDNRCVVVVDKDYAFRFRYKGHGNKGFTPYGICTDESGQILILDSCSRCIHILNQDGIYQGDIGLSDYLKQPRGLCIEDNSRCYVGSYGSISVYNYILHEKQATDKSAE